MDLKAAAQQVFALPDPVAVTCLADVPARPVVPGRGAWLAAWARHPLDAAPRKAARDARYTGLLHAALATLHDSPTFAAMIAAQPALNTVPVLYLPLADATLRGTYNGYVCINTRHFYRDMLMFPEKIMGVPPSLPLTLAHEFRHAACVYGGAFPARALNGATALCEQTLIEEADARAFEAAIAWELRHRDSSLFAAFTIGNFRMARAFRQAAVDDPAAARDGRAQAAAAQAWFASEASVNVYAASTILKVRKALAAYERDGGGPVDAVCPPFSYRVLPPMPWRAADGVMNARAAYILPPDMTRERALRKVKPSLRAGLEQLDQAIFKRHNYP